MKTERSCLSALVTQRSTWSATNAHRGVIHAYNFTFIEFDVDKQVVDWILCFIQSNNFFFHFFPLLSQSSYVFRWSLSYLHG